MSPIKGTNAISIIHIINIRYSSVVFCSFAEMKSPIMINSIAPTAPAIIIKYCGNSHRNTLPKNSVPNMSCPRFTRTFPLFSLMSVFLPFFIGFLSFPMPILYRFLRRGTRENACHPRATPKLTVTFFTYCFVHTKAGGSLVYVPGVPFSDVA